MTMSSRTQQATLSRFFPKADDSSRLGSRKRPLEVVDLVSDEEHDKDSYTVEKSEEGSSIRPEQVDKKIRKKGLHHDEEKIDVESSIQEPNAEIVLPPESDTSGDKSSETVAPNLPKNPFAAFAFHGQNDLNIIALPSRHESQSNIRNDGFAPPAKKDKSKKKANQWIPMKELSASEQLRITQKWHSLADPEAPLETRRFQVLLAARLHARCQEPSVRKAMERLRAEYKPLSVSVIAQAESDHLASCITNLQFYNAKAAQAISAAQEIERKYAGEVPEDEASLLDITGIGKVFADLLAFVNTRKAHMAASEP